MVVLLMANIVCLRGVDVRDRETVIVALVTDSCREIALSLVSDSLRLNS